MSYIIRNSLVWFLAPAVLLVGLVILCGCEGSPDLTGSPAPPPLDETPYGELARQQYEALDFIDRDVQRRAAALGKRPEGRQLQLLALEANEEWLAREGVAQEKIRALHESFAVHLQGARSADESRSLAAILTKQGFSSRQQRYIRRLVTSVKTARSFAALQEELRRVAGDVRAALPEREAIPVMYVAARMEGIGRFLQERQPLAYPEQRGNSRQMLSMTSGKGLFDPNPKCLRGPRPVRYFHKSWKYYRDALTGFGLGCGIGSSMFGWTVAGAPVACALAGSNGMGIGIYWRYLKGEEEYLSSLRAWCDECVYAAESPSSGVGTCRVKFPGDYPKQSVVDEHLGFVHQGRR